MGHDVFGGNDTDEAWENEEEKRLIVSKGKEGQTWPAELSTGTAITFQWNLKDK